MMHGQKNIKLHLMKTAVHISNTVGPAQIKTNFEMITCSYLLYPIEWWVLFQPGSDTASLYLYVNGCTALINLKASGLQWMWI